MGLRGRKACWHEVGRTLKSLTPDQQRGASGNNAAGALEGSVLLLVKHGDQPVVQYVYGRTAGLRAAGNQVGFTVKPLDADHEPELPEGVSVAAHPVIPWTSRLNRTSNMERLRTDLSEVRRSIEAAMPADSYVSVSIRAHGSIMEDRNIRDWIASEHNNPEDEDPLVRNGAMCARVSCGADDAEKAGQLAKAVGGTLFNDMSSMGEHRSRPKFGLLAGSVVLGVLWALTVALSSWPLWPSVAVPASVTLAALAAWSGVYLTTHANIGPQLTAGCAVAWVLWALGLLDLPLILAVLPLPVVAVAGVRLWRASLWDDIMQRPRHYWGRVNRRKASKADNEESGSSDERNRTVIAYGTQRSTLLMGPAVTVAAFTPVGDAVAVSQMPHPVPETLARGGVYLGEDQYGRKGYLDATQLYNGVAIIGEAGSGKSVLTHGIMQWADMYRSKSERSYWGWDTRVISFEMKDDGGVRTMRRYRKAHHLAEQWAREGQPGRLDHVSYLADESTRCLDLLGMLDGRSAKDTAVAIAAGMQYSFEPGAIFADSLDRLTNAFTMGVAATRYEMMLDRRAGKGVAVPEGDHIHARMRLLEAQYPGAGQARAQRSPVGWAATALCIGDGQLGSARALGEVLRGLSNQYPDNADLQQARRAAEQMYGRPKAKIGDRQVLEGCRSASTKVSQLLPCEHVFDPRRATLTWRGVLKGRGDFHFVLAPRHMDDGTVRQLPERMDRVLGAWLMYRLWNEVTAECQGWREQGRHTMLVCDELSMLANADPRVLSQVREQGRSFGVIPVFATQFPQQLRSLGANGGEELFNSFMGYGSFISYNTSNTATAQQVAEIMSDRDDGSDGWTTATIRNLRRYEIAVRTRTQRQTQPAFLLQAHNFDDVEAGE